MTLVKWTPNRSMVNMFDDFDSIFNNLFNASKQNINSWSPAFSVKENNNDYIVYADMPGMQKKDLTVEVEDGTLFISGERKANDDNESSYYGYQRYGEFSRSFNLPDNCDGNNVSAKLKNGVLTLTIPKVEKVRNVKQISIK